LDNTQQWTVKQIKHLPVAPNSKCQCFQTVTPQLPAFSSFLLFAFQNFKLLNVKTDFQEVSVATVIIQLSALQKVSLLKKFTI
jgi:hypothetical protein